MIIDKQAENKLQAEDNSDFSGTEHPDTPVKEPKVFYRGYKKAREHGLFSLIYQDYPMMCQRALADRLAGYQLIYRSKLTKIEGLISRLTRLKERQAAEDKEASNY